MSGITYVDHDSGATFVHGHVHLRQSDRCLTGSCVNVPLRDRIAAALNSGTVIDAIERIIETELRLRTDALNRTGASNDQLRAELADANARLANVEALHHPLDESDPDSCVCCNDDWPCPTAAAIRAALGGGRDEPDPIREGAWVCGECGIEVAGNAEGPAPHDCPMSWRVDGAR